MSREKLRVANTALDNLVGNLRGEVGEVVTTWLLMRQFMSERSRIITGDPAQDINNRQLAFRHIIEDKLRDELIGRLSELAEKKTGRLTFHFASRKIDSLDPEVTVFEKFIICNKIREKRNRDVSHKELPEKWSQQSVIHISYRVIVKSVAMALRLMKRIDRQVLGPSAPYLWREARKKRYEFTSPPRVGYLLIPYLRLSEKDRLQILKEEIRDGSHVWTEITTKINGKSARIMVCKKWGIIALGDRLLALDEYPLQELHALETDSVDSC